MLGDYGNETRVGMKVGSFSMVRNQQIQEKGM